MEKLKTWTRAYHELHINHKNVMPRGRIGTFERVIGSEDQYLQHLLLRHKERRGIHDDAIGK